jgi:hypothetical protein
MGEVVGVWPLSGRHVLLHRRGRVSFGIALQKREQRPFVACLRFRAKTHYLTGALKVDPDCGYLADGRDDGKDVEVSQDAMDSGEREMEHGIH